MAGIYIIAFLYPFNYFEFVYGQINVPYVDLIAIVLFFAWLLKAFYLFLSKRQKLNLKNFPGWFFMLVFVSVSALSLINVESEYLSQAIKYLFRPVIFFYLMYVILPFNIIDNLKRLFNTFKIMFVLGSGLACMGIWSLIFPPIEGLRRAVPISIFGVSPLGTNHNALAEILVCLIPVALILFWYEKDIFWKNVYLLGVFLMAGINLLTLSRSGWLALFMVLLVLVLLKYRALVKKIVKSYLFYILLILSTPALYLMYKLLTSRIATSSDLNRLKLIEIALMMFNKHPWIGSGVGTFTTVVAQVKWYIIEYWVVLDAHGFLFKTLAETGLVGAISFIGFLVYILYALFKAYNKNRKTKHEWLLLGVLLVAVAGITFQFFSTSYYIAKFWFPLGLALTGLKFVKNKPNKPLYGKK